MRAKDTERRYRENEVLLIPAGKQAFIKGDFEKIQVNRQYFRPSAFSTAEVYSISDNKHCFHQKLPYKG